MKLNHDGALSLVRVGRVLGGGLCALLFATGCGPAGRELLEDLFDSVGDGHGHGGHNPPPPTSCGPIDFDQLFTLINDDLAGEDTDDAINYRYLSLANRGGEVGCGTELDVDRRALVKLVNSLSVSPTINEPLGVDAEGTLFRIDLRDYEWDRTISVNGVNFVDAWEAIAAANPYAVPFVGDDIEDAVADTGTAVPVMLADSLLATAAVDELYYALIGVPEDVDDFILNDLEIDIAANFADREVIRAGFSGDSLGLPDSAFLAERHDNEVRNGYLWQISEFGGGPDGLFEDPLGQPQGDRELVFTLPNGMLGFALATADGQRLNDSDLLLDFSQSNFRYRIATSAFAKFAQGVDVTDEVRDFALDNLDLSPDEEDLLRDIYPDAADLAAILASDRDQFYASALAQANLDINDPEPISAVFAAFNSDVDLASAAGDLLVSTEFMEANLGELDPAVQILGNGANLDRDDWTSHYLDSLCIFTIVLDNAVDPALCN